MNLTQYRRRHLIMIFILTVLMVLVVLRRAAAQNQTGGENYERSYYVNGGLGFGGSGNALLIELNVQCSERGMLSFGFDGAGPLGTYGQANTTAAASFYLGYGKIKRGRAGLASWSVGPAYTDITKYGDALLPPIPVYPTTNSKVLSLHLQAEMIWAGSLAGVGLTAFADINSNYPYAGLTVSIALGKLNFLKK